MIRDDVFGEIRYLNQSQIGARSMDDFLFGLIPTYVFLPTFYCSSSLLCLWVTMVEGYGVQEGQGITSPNVVTMRVTFPFLLVTISVL
jgi:hypothetical protein